MKKIGVIFGVLAVAGLIAFVVKAAYIVPLIGTLDPTSKAYTEKVVADIAGSWDFDVYASYCSETALKSTDKEAAEKMFSTLKKVLGPCKSIKETKGEAFVKFLIGAPTLITADYDSTVVFKSQEVNIHTKLEYVNKQWKLLGIKFGS